jgi:ornithine cyclodeaminase/alanine dehydrogenase-like protein (mu-crystallin family)
LENKQMIIINADTATQLLTYDVCIPLMRDAMIALSSGDTRQLLRGIIDLEEKRAFGVMPGAMGRSTGFGAKLVSVYPERFERSLPSHQGVIVVFDQATGAPVCVVHGGEITAIRTASTSAAATDALARPNSTCLTVLGYGEQARRHISSIAKVRNITRVKIWGRSMVRAEALAKEISEDEGIACECADTVELAVADADVICTVTAAAEPILYKQWVAPGTHINVVGSSRAGPTEIDNLLISGARFFADHRQSVLQQGAEFLSAKQAGLITDNHILGEIGEVFNGTLDGRVNDSDVTIFKSLGNIVQDLASAWWLYERAIQQGLGVRVEF